MYVFEAFYFFVLMGVGRAVMGTLWGEMGLGLRRDGK